METVLYLYLLIGSMWFFQVWKETGDLSNSVIIGLFWIYEVFEILMRKSKNLWKQH